MTVIKSNGLIKKSTIVNPATFEKNVKRVKCSMREGKIEIPLERYSHPKRSPNNSFCCMVLGALLITFCGFVVGYMLYQIKPPTRRYRGFCYVMTPQEEQDAQVRASYRVPPRWSSEPDVQVITTLKDEAGEDFVNALREELDLADTMEKISVIDNGHRVNFIHDFTENITGIIDDDRCFIMDLDRDSVLSPELFISGLEQGSNFDVSRMRSNLRADLPALQMLSRVAMELATKCTLRPVYRLVITENGGIRKRSIDDPKHDYIQFSGKHVTEIKIENLPEILEYEKQNKTLIRDVA